MLKREWGVESNGKLPHLFIPSKTATWVPDIAMEDLPLGRIAALVPEFAMKDLPLGRTVMMIYIIERSSCTCMYLEVFRARQYLKSLAPVMNDYDGQMIFGDLGGLKLHEICLTGEDKPRKIITQETCPDRGSNPGPLRDRRACYRLYHRGGLSCT